MSLLSIVQDCWETFGYTVKVGALTAGLLAGGFISSLYAQEPVPGWKPKDTPELQEKYAAEQAKKKEEAAKEEQRKAKETRETPWRPADNQTRVSLRDPNAPREGWKRSSRLISTFLRANYTAETSDLVPADVDHRLDLVLEVVKDDAYGKLSASGISEQCKNDGSELRIDFKGYGTFDIGKDNPSNVKLSFLLDSLALGTNEVGGILGAGLEFKGANIFATIGGNWRDDTFSISYSTPFPHHSESKYTTSSFLWSVATRFGDEIGLDVRTDMTPYLFVREEYDLPFTMLPPALCDIKERKKGAYESYIFTVFYEPKKRMSFAKDREDENGFANLIAMYYRYDARITGGQYNQDGTPINEEDKNYLYEYYLFDFYGFANLSNGSGPDTLGMLGAFCTFDRFVNRYGANVALGHRSNGNPLARQMVQHNRSIFRLKHMRAEKNLQDIAYNCDKGFHYDIGFGVVYEEPRPDFEYAFRKLLYAVVEANLFQCTKIGNLGLNIQGRIDTITGQHPGMLQVQANLFGPMSIGIFYSLEFDDVSKLSAADGAKHTLGASIGANF